MQRKGTKRNNRENTVKRLFRGIFRKSVMSKETNDMIDRWLLGNMNDPEHFEAMREIFDKGFKVSDAPSKVCLDSLAKVKQRLGIEPATPQPVKVPLLRRTYIKVASAAAVALIVFGVTYTTLRLKDTTAPDGGTPTLVTDHTDRTPQVPHATIEVIEGVQKEALLADGTHVWVNSGSTLTYPEVFADGERRVTLKGEAFFEVEHDATKPFTVHTGHLDVRVLGTKFNVAEQEAGQLTVVTLHEGSVEVTANGHSQKLTPGDRLTYRHQSGEMEVERFTAQTAQDWRSATIFADDKSMPEILRMIGNYYDLTVEYDSAAFPAGERYSLGFYKDDSAQKVLDMLVEASGGSFSYERQNDTIKIYGRK